MTYRKKLIEVALPLEAINVASAREKSIRHGHPSTLHLWWARRPLAACRAVLFSSIIDDPDQPSVPEDLLKEIDKLPKPAKAGIEYAKMTLNEQRRQKLFDFIEQLVQWENSNNETILKTAHRLIMAATDGNPPPVLDPFAGGGSIPLEAQRLGLEAHASDLNPVAVLINKALIEIPPKFANQPPVNPESRRGMGHSGQWKGATGLAEDVRYYGQWIRDEAFKRIGQAYPKAQIPKEQGGGEATVIAWIWARTVKCPNPACGAIMPLVRSFVLSTKKGQAARVEPKIDRTAKTITYEVKTSQGEPLEGTVNRQGSRCIVCNQPVSLDYIRIEGKAGRIKAELLAVVAEGKKRRIYLSPDSLQINKALTVQPNWKPDSALPEQALGFRIQLYGMTKHSDLFTDRQLVALTTFSDLIVEVKLQILKDIFANHDNYKEAEEYANSVVTYLAFAIDRLAMTGNSLVRWNPVGEKAQHAFGRQTLSMLWDFAETNFFADATGSIGAAIELVAGPLSLLKGNRGFVEQQDATKLVTNSVKPIISTDPPYYDNIGYADLSDFFYVWLRHTLQSIHPNLFNTLLTPKVSELIASPFRFEGNKQKAQEFFEEGLGNAFIKMREIQNSNLPLTVFYAFKQTEEDDEDNTEEITTASTGWETMLQGLIKAGFSINGTWPVRTEMGSRMRGQDSNALASSIVLVCRPRSETASISSRREFLTTLKRELPAALRNLQHGNIAPVDLAQASIGPGMAVFSRYSKVLESDGRPMRVRTALQIINQTLDEVLSEQEGEYDADTRWAIAWFEQFGQTEGQYGVAETLSKAKDTSIQGLVEAGVLQAKAGKVRLLRRDELSEDWNPQTDRRLTIWEITQYLIRALDKEGELAAANLLAKLGEKGEIARDLAYRLYVTCDRKGWTQEALAYNSLVVAWPQTSTLAAQVDTRVMRQGTLL